MEQDLYLWSLLHHVHAALRRGKRKDPARPRGLGHVLELLDPKKPRHPGDLAEMLGIRPQSVSEALLYLEERGEICRREDPQDKRSCLITLTQEGERARALAAEERKRRAEALFSPLTPKEKEELSALLEKLLEKGEA